MYPGSRAQRRSQRAQRKPRAVLVDLDGTLVDVSSARHHVLQEPRDFNAFHAAGEHCPPHQMALDWVTRKHLSGDTILIVTARMEMWRDVSKHWLANHVTVPFYGPFMRPDGDYRPDSDVKREIFHRLSQAYDIHSAIDDQPECIELWRSLNIKTTVVPGWCAE
jgi:beta-phosphoglucomutase-like phosphatase (HAD superfamily)